MPTGRIETRRAHAFSLIELVVVVVILGVVAIIAIPRFSSASTTAVINATVANVAVLERAIAHYSAEHEERTPAHDATGEVNTDETTFAKRLMHNSNQAGDTGARLPLGPYVSELPHNPVNGRRRVRVDGAAAGANTHGWRFDSRLRVIEPDDLFMPAYLTGRSAALNVTKPPAGTEEAVDALPPEAFK